MFKRLYTRIKGKIHDIKLCNKAKELMKDEEKLVEHLRNLESKVMLCDDEKATIVYIGEILQICLISYSLDPRYSDNKDIHDILQTIKPYMNHIDINKYL